MKELVAAAGFTGARTTRQFVLRPDSDGLSMPTTLQVYPRLLRCGNLRDLIRLLSTGLDRSDEFSVVRSIWSGWSSFGAALLHSVTQDDRVFHLWGHSWEINELDLWQKLEMFLGVVKSCAQETATNSGTIRSSRKLPLWPAEVPRAASSG